MNKILLIDETYIKQNSSVYDNVDPKILKNHIFETQNINLKYLLPKDLYDDLFLQLNDFRDYKISGGTDVIADQVDARLLDLIEELKPMLLYYSLYNAAFSLFTRITNKGINNQTSDYSDTISEEILYSLKKDWKHKAESYSNLVNEYLYDNIETYPEYTDSCTTTNKPYTSPLYLGGSI